MNKQLPRSPMDIFRNLPEGARVQLIENVIVMEPCPAYAHQEMLGEIYLSMANFVKSRNLGKVLFAPFDVYLDEENAFQPDIFFVAAHRVHLIRPDGLNGAPDLVVEALSPSTGKYDRRDKKDMYERSGVGEYWIVDPDTFQVQGYRLVNGAFKAFPAGEGVIHSQLLGSEFRI